MAEAILTLSHALDRAKAGLPNLLGQAYRQKNLGAMAAESR